MARRAIVPSGCFRLYRAMSLLRPSAVASALDLLTGDAERWIVGNAAFRHRPLKHRAQRVEKIALPERSAALLVDHALHMFAVQHHDAATICLNSVNALVTVCLAEIFEDISPCAPRFCGEGLEW